MLVVAVLRRVVVGALVGSARVSTASHPFWNVRLRFLLFERREGGGGGSASTLGRAVPGGVSARAEIVVDILVVNLAFATTSLEGRARL